jgi:hypothetical protein
MLRRKLWSSGKGFFMSQQRNKILTKMLDRLFAALVNGPSLNCKPHSSRQRIDLIQFAKLHDISPGQLLNDLLAEAHTAKVVARVQPPKGRTDVATNNSASDDEIADKLSPEEKAAQLAWTDQQALIAKLRMIAEDAKTYENDTGVHTLHIGLPLLSLPPGSFGLQRNLTRRILAPIAFIPVSLSIRGGASPTILLEGKSDGQEVVTPNSALLAWLEQQTGQSAVEGSSEESEKSPLHLIAALVQRIAKLLELPTPESFLGEALSELPTLQPAPKSEEQDAKATILSSAILGLFPMSNQGLIRDMQAMVQGDSITGPVQSFLNIDTDLLAQSAESDEAPVADVPVAKKVRVFAEERLVTGADPCQSRAVKLARTNRGLVIHGPPGTGKSQTITNIIGDHISRGQRVLLVCDKRTALDVVMNRLDGLGLGQLCATVHDAQRDQRELYKSIREQLDNLTDARTNAHAEGELVKVDAELQKLHTELNAYYTALMDGVPFGSNSFHELVGKWLSFPSFNVAFKESFLQGVGSDEFDDHIQEIGSLLERAEVASYRNNPWVESAGLSLQDFLATPMDQMRDAMSNCVAVAEGVDTTIDLSIPPFAAEVDLNDQAHHRVQLADLLSQPVEPSGQSIRSHWANADINAVRQGRQKLTDVKPLIETLQSGPLDTELSLAVRSQLPTLAIIGQQTASIDNYLTVASKWYSVFAFKKKSLAQKALSEYGLSLTLENGQRLKKFLLGLRARMILGALHQDFTGQPTSVGLIADDVLNASLSGHAALFDMLVYVVDEPSLQPLAPLVAKALSNPSDAAAIIEGLRKSPARAEAILRLEKTLDEAGMFAAPWLSKLKAALLAGEAAGETLKGLSSILGTLEGVVRVREGLVALPTALQTSTAKLVHQGVGSQTGLIVLKKSMLSLQIIDRLKSDPKLQGSDSQKLRSSFERYRTLDQHKKTLVRDVILNFWVGRQKQRLLAGTGSRLNGEGADLRRRLTIRGQRAMRLRQVVAVGQDTEGGDPLFDMRPVWMASPETVAQIFNRQPLFDVVIFDEASQCRLEEALPVLTRAKRLVVAGDPKQLPPTRFFESALSVSDDEEIETDQQLFEVQQGEIEDLLAASLNIEIQECYLDVHYRSRNADLIEFSNQQFYNSRLQAIPGHPANRTRYAPLTLYKCHGVYEKRSNPAEADQVCKIVQDLLRRSHPPSIGIACFNLQQRDLILDQLETLAMNDSEFGRKFAEARTRRSSGSFDGLFVKNLESVQGDERDHIIISTTFGPDNKGRFYRRFGPLGRSGGGRRINVLVTRAREEVHLVTSIPESVYRAMPPIPPGETPGGAWLLFSYLSYAERLAEQYEMNHQLLSQIEPDQEATVNIRASKWPSQFSQSLAQRLAKKHNVGSDVHWGNDGFCVDVALHHPQRAEDVTVGVMCDLTRFAQAEDPVEWELFRTGVLESQGWRLHRLWTPHFFRDRQGCTEAILKDVAEMLANEEEKDAIRVVGVEGGSDSDSA